MNDRDLSEKLDAIASKLEVLSTDHIELIPIIKELRELSNEKYAPGNSLTWTDVNPKAVKKVYMDKTTGKKLPF